MTRPRGPLWIGGKGRTRVRDGGRTFAAWQAATPRYRVHASWLLMEAKPLADGLLGVVFVSHKPMVRGALEALFWMQTSPVPCVVASELSEAMDTARDWLIAAGDDVSKLPQFDDDPRIDGVRIEPADP